MTGRTIRKSLPGLVLALAAAVPLGSQAADVAPVFKLGLDFGGDKVATAVFTSGKTESLKANELFYLGGGVSIISDSREIETEVTISYKFDSINASNGEIKFDRLPIEALVFYR